MILKRETRRSRTAEIGFQKEYEDYEVNVGDPCTLRYYSDREPATIIEIDPQGRWIKVQEDNAIRIDHNGMSDCQEYIYERNPNGYIYTFKRTRKDYNVYTDNGQYHDWGIKLIIGYRCKYYDYSF